MSQDLSTVLICPVCKCTLFKEKNAEGSILLQCAQCGGSAKVSKAGIGFAVVEQVQESGAVFPVSTEIQKKWDKEEKAKFEILEFRLPSAVKKIIQAALWAAKCQMQIRGSWYGGAVLAHICADYLSGVDYERLGPRDLERVSLMLQSAAEDVERQLNNGEVFQAYPKGFQESAVMAVAKATAAVEDELPAMVKRKQDEHERTKREMRQTSIGKAIHARSEKSMLRLERCIRILKMQLQMANELDSAEDAIDRDFLMRSLEKGELILGGVRSGVLKLSSSGVQRFMASIEKRLGIPSPRKREREEV